MSIPTGDEATNPLEKLSTGTITGRLLSDQLSSAPIASTTFSTLVPITVPIQEQIFKLIKTEDKNYHALFIVILKIK